jgi:hypothetical protein
MGESQPPSRNVAMTTLAINPVDPPGEWEVVNHDQLGAVMPAECEVSSVSRPQMANDAMIMYSTRMTQPSNRIVTFTPITAIAITSRQTTVATTHVSGSTAALGNPVDRDALGLGGTQHGVEYPRSLDARDLDAEGGAIRKGRSVRARTGDAQSDQHVRDPAPHVRSSALSYSERAVVFCCTEMFSLIPNFR